MTPQKRIGAVTAGEAGGPSGTRAFRAPCHTASPFYKRVRRSAHGRPPGARAAPASARTLSSSASPRSCARCPRAELRQRVVQVDDLVEPRLEEVALPAVP